MKIQSIPNRYYTRAKKICSLAISSALAFALTISFTPTSHAASPQQSAIIQAGWFKNVKVEATGDIVTIESNGIPNWMAEKYAKPNAGIIVPTSPNDVTLDLGSRLVMSQNYNFAITMNPTKASTTTPTALGPIGILVNGAVVFNPYEGDGKAVAVTGNVFLSDSNGVKWGFLDECNGHPGMGGMYHYHGMPPCVTSVIDKSGGPSHILGIAFDGYLIYGDKDITGKTVSSTQLDTCNGITSPTPEFPTGVYHYVLTQEKSNRSTINCFTGTPNPTLTKGGGPQPGGMGPMPGMGGPPGPPGQQPPNGQQPPVMPTPITTPIPTPSPSMSATPSPSMSATPSPTATPRYTTLYKPVKSTQLVCKKGTVRRTIFAKVCPPGYTKISSKIVTSFVKTKVMVMP